MLLKEQFLFSIAVTDKSLLRAKAVGGKYSPAWSFSLLKYGMGGSRRDA